MKKRMFGLLASVMLSVFLLAGCGSSPAASTSGSGDYHGALKGVELAVGTSGTYAPFSYFDKDGTTLTGYDVELMGKLQEILGFTLKDGAMKDMDYGPLGTSLSQGQLDVGAAALCATDERKKTMKFSDTYYDAGIVVIVAKDNTAIKSVDDLKTGKYKVAVQTGWLKYYYPAEGQVVTSSLLLLLQTKSKKDFLILSFCSSGPTEKWKWKKFRRLAIKLKELTSQELTEGICSQT